MSDEYEITDTVRKVVDSVGVYHQISDTPRCFRHRLVVDGVAGEWVSYEWFAKVQVLGRTYMACQGNWQPMFPSIFLIKEAV